MTSTINFVMRNFLLQQTINFDIRIRMVLARHTLSGNIRHSQCLNDIEGCIRVSVIAHCFTGIFSGEKCCIEFT